MKSVIQLWRLSWELSPPCYETLLLAFDAAAVGADRQAGRCLGETQSFAMVTGRQIWSTVLLGDSTAT